MEIIGLSKSAIRWIVELHGKGLFPYDGAKFHRNGIKHTLQINISICNPILFHCCFFLQFLQEQHDRGLSAVIH